MSVISWDETLPASGTTASTVDDIIRSDVTAIATVLGVSRFWPGSAATQGASTASSGEMRPGTARPARGANLRVGNAPDGTLVFDSDNSSLAHAGSTATYMLGSRHMEEHTTVTGLGAAHWVVASGSASWAIDPADNDTLNVSFGVTYGASPVVMASLSSDAYLWCLSSVSTTGFSSMASNLAAGGLSTQTLQWWSQGTVAF